MVKIEINDKVFKVQCADTEELREKGLQGVKEMPENEGMLFIFDEPTTAAFWMKDTLIPLDIIYIDEYGEVRAVFRGVPDSLELHECNGIKYVLELNINSGVCVGQDVDLSEVEGDYDIDEEDEEEVTMKVLDAKGGSQMDLKGGERIFSRANTKTLVRLAKRAYKSKSDKDYKALGRKIFQYLETQDNKEDDYVELPK